MAALEISPVEARRMVLRAQGVLGAPDRRSGVAGLLRHLGAVQLDTISVLARSHELIAYARLGAVGRDTVEHAFWGTGAAFEYWAHAACLLPIEQWQLFSFRRRRFRARGQRWHKVPEGIGARILTRLQEEGPLTATDLGGAQRGGPWWAWSDVKVAVEWLLDIGEVTCTRRQGWRRVYDLPERVLPVELLREAELDDAGCLRSLAEIAGRSLGIATLADLADFHRVTRADISSVIGETNLVEVRVPGWGKAWAHPHALSALAARGRHRTTLLSPFDSLVWDRRRTQRIFAFTHRLEAYVPAPKRIHGYFAMPLLGGGRLVGRVDPGREGRTLIAKRLSMQPSAIGAMARALREAATWVGCDNVVVQDVQPPKLALPLRAALA